MESTRLLELTLEGSDPLAWGRQHGEAFAGQIREMAAIRRQLLVARFVDWPQTQIDQLCDDQMAALDARWPRVAAEVRGISEASGVSLRDIIILNAYTDLKDFEAGVAEEGGCSLLAAKGPNVNFSGQTWDMHAAAEPYTMLLTVPAVRHTRVVTITGCVALSGGNDAGVSVLINDLQCAETNRQGLIWPALVRMMLEQPSAQAAADVLANNLPSSGHNYLIADAEQAFNVETTGRHHEVTARLDSGYVGHTNHYLGTLKRHERTEKISPTTKKRLAAVEAFFAAHPIESMTTDALMQAFFEHGPLCDGVLQCGTEPTASRTCAGVAVDHGAKKGYAWRGRYDRSQRIEWAW